MTTSVIGSVLNADTYSETPGNRKGIVCAGCYVPITGESTNEDTVATLLNDASPKNFEDLYYQTTPVVCRLGEFAVDVHVDAVSTQRPTVSVALAIIADNAGDGYTVVKYLTRTTYSLFGGGGASDDLPTENVPQFVLNAGQNLAVIVFNSLPEAAGDDTCVAAVSVNGTVYYTQ